MVAGKHALSLRTSAARNNQRAAINFAAEYELGAVAQLAERRYGIPEAEGSSPSSSTPELDASAPASEGVGAHEFRNHFGYYMELANGGREILIRRRGKPYARLGPPVLK